MADVFVLNPLNIRLTLPKVRGEVLDEREERHEVTLDVRVVSRRSLGRNSILPDTMSDLILE